MNTPANHTDADRSDDAADALLKEWLQEAGDTPMTPRPEHVSQLRERLLAQTQATPIIEDAAASTTVTPDEPSSATRTTRRSWGIFVLVTVAVLVAVSLFSGNEPQNVAWAQTKAAVRAMQWMMTKTQVEGGAVIESWFSPQRLIAAMRAVSPAETETDAPVGFAMFVDIRRGTRLEYQPQNNEIVKSPMLSSDETSMRLVGGFLSAFADGKDLKEFVEAESNLTITSQREVILDGKRFDEFEAVVNFHGHNSTVIYRVDSETKLPVSMMTTIDGQLRTTAVSFPDQGPGSIYDLGIAQDVSTRNHMPAPELARLLTQRQRVRTNFDRYYGISIQVQPGKHWANSVRVNRLWRSGNKWRTEYLIWDGADSERIHRREAPPDGTDPLEWWSDHVPHERFRPTTMSDGKNTWRFEYDAKQSADDPKRWDYTIKPATKNPYPIDPENPMPTIITYPEFLMYGATGLPGPRRKGVLTLHPEDGPEATVLIESRTMGKPRLNGNDLSYYWVDPLENGMTRKTEMLSLMSEEPKLLGEQLVLGTARSPKGFLYPTQLQHDSGVVTHFYLDFDAKFDDTVFDPTLNKTAPLPR
jgi:hypothetical protein